MIFMPFSEPLTKVKSWTCGHSGEAYSGLDENRDYPNWDGVYITPYGACVFRQNSSDIKGSQRIQRGTFFSIAFARC
jgi:hypothetical protein